MSVKQKQQRLYSSGDTAHLKIMFGRD